MITGRGTRLRIVRKTKPTARYFCGLDHCQAIVELPLRSMTADYRHRDKNGFVCNGLLVLMEYTAQGRQEKLDAMFQKEMRKRYRQQTGHD